VGVWLAVRRGARLGPPPAPASPHRRIDPGRGAAVLSPGDAPPPRGARSGDGGVSGGAGSTGGQAGLRQGKAVAGSWEAASASTEGIVGCWSARLSPALPLLPAPPHPCAPSRPRPSGAPPATPEPSLSAAASEREPERVPELEPKLEPALRRTERSAAAKPSKGRGAGSGAGERRGEGPGPFPRALQRHPERTHPGARRAEPRAPGGRMRGPERNRSALGTERDPGTLADPRPSSRVPELGTWAGRGGCP
jgi:hypothetical protein